MLRQLARLTRPVGAVDGAVALAVYADETGRLLPATDRGHEGVACVDDAARALVLLCDLWSATRLPLVRAWAEGLLEFVLHMQDGDGRFVNFILDWSGARNAHGETSFAGGSFWQARGVHALVRASLTLGDARATRGAVLGMAQLRGAPGAVPPDVRAIHVLAALDVLRAGGAPGLEADVAAWCEELVACRRGGVLFDNPDQDEPHLWAHMQEGALLDAGVHLGRPDLIAVARESVRAYLAPIIEGGFDLPRVQPYGVACALFGALRLAAVDDGPAPRRLVELSRAWFHERNTAGLPAYDRFAGRVHDGIDAGVLNSHSGAESNIAGAEALLPELPALAAVHRRMLEGQLLPVLGDVGAQPYRASSL